MCVHKGLSKLLSAADKLNEQSNTINNMVMTSDTYTRILLFTIHISTAYHNYSQVKVLMVKMDL